ncbi:hypothetical protein [Nocardioides sp. InS609-2]|uniref:hypothetical protein n=1 Tax=Nocardioides sp. InS609-2 TaxID=2760705 RepID=UPI0020BF87CB|nr:hypothetical protein [Nocardioides sp. InS609-2]
MKYTPSRAALGVVACLAIVLAGVAMVTPAGASLTHDAQAVAKHNWSKIWRQKLQPKADQRYWTKAQADSKYAGRTDSYTKLESDSKYYTKADSDSKYYSKTESDTKYQVKQKIYRGTYLAGAPSTAAGAFVFGDLSYGVTLTAAPTAHYIQTGAAVPAGCSGTAAAPGADPGHLCVFESQAFNVGATRFVTDLAFNASTATPTGAWLYASTVGANYGFFGGTWAMQPGGAATVSSLKGASPSFGPTVGMPH